jgi:flagellar assembly protein FliH
MSRAQSAFIPSDRIQAVSDWNFTAVDQSAIKFAAKLKAQAEAEEKAQSEQVRQAGYSEGYAEGFAQGHAQATLEGQRHITAFIKDQGQVAAQTFLKLFASAQDQLLESEQVIAQGALQLACELSRQVLRHELATNPNALLPVVREALGMLVADSKAALVRLNPLDVEVFGDVLKAEFTNLTLQLLADPTIQRGGCLVESVGTVVDGTVERRWQRAIASLGLDPAETPWEAPGDDDR